MVAYALAGTTRIDLTQEPLGKDAQGKPVYLKDIWPSQAEVAAAVATSESQSMFAKEYAEVFKGTKNGKKFRLPKALLINGKQIPLMSNIRHFLPT